ncbi:MAG TPA: hypothetical protein VK796_04220, partial [Cytophaga sp.]|nr:hypothetical protein [Cytophaga sp.]
MRISCILLFFFNYCLSIQAQTSQWFRDDFNSNEQNWYVGTSLGTDYTVSDGHYILNNKNILKTRCWVTKNIYINPVKDFSMEVKLKIPTSNGNGTAGFFITDIWGMKNFFCINPYDNSFSIGLTGSKTTSYYTYNEETGEPAEFQPTNAFTSATDYQVLK